MSAPRLERASLSELRRAALQDFPEPDSAALIELYIGELGHLMDPAPAEQPSSDAARHEATSASTHEDAVTLLCKLEDYLESILVGRWTKRPGT